MDKFIEKINNCKVSCSSIRSVYEWDGLTWQELICEVFKGVNDCIETVNNYTNLVSDIVKWITNEGLENEVKKGLDKLIEDGTISEIINGEIFGNILNDITRLENLIKNNADDIENVKIEMEALKEKILTDVKEALKGLVTRVEKLENKPSVTEIFILKNEKDYGDCSLIKADDGSYSMIDCMWETNYNTLIKQLNKIGVKKLKYLFITHDHSDHIGNAPTIIKLLRPDYLVCKTDIDYSRLPPEETSWDTKGYHDRMIQACNDNGTEVIPANDQEIKIGFNDTVKLYNSHFYDYSNLNGMSVTYMLKSYGCKALFVGDSPASCENNLRNQIGRVDLLKLSHHGADGGNTDEWINELKPLIGCINRLREYKTFIVENNALKVIREGGKIYSNDNNEFMSFSIIDGRIIPNCNEYILPCKFITVGDKFKLTDYSGNIATTGIYSYKTDQYFVKENGFVAQGEWVHYHGVYYYANSSGVLVKNQFVEGTDNGQKVWYWMNDRAELVNGWEFVNYNNNSYIIKPNGMMVDSGWTSFQGNHYYAGKNGPLYHEKWLEEEGKYYYFYSDCTMVKSEKIFINGKWYTFDSDGVCTTPNGEDN